MARRATKGNEESLLVGRTPTSALDPQVQTLPSQGARLRVRGPALPRAFSSTERYPTATQTSLDSPAGARYRFFTVAAQKANARGRPAFE
jgi:hypothetical protein